MFWQFPESFLQNTAVVTDSETLSYAKLQKRYEQFMLLLPTRGTLIGLLCQNTLETLIAWLACLNKGVPVLLLDGNTSDENIQAIIDRFCPAALIQNGLVKPCQESNRDLNIKIDPRLAVMISTSGSTGSAKQVALSYDNLQANAESICQYLPIRSDDITITTLPFHYSYGLSVINTHLASGAAILLSEHSIMSREFWAALSERSVTSFAGVPYTYEMLRRLGFLKKEFTALRYLTQAGGRLSDDLVDEFSSYMRQRQKGFYVMYGQTEATARMAWLSPDKLPQKLGSIGSAIPGGELFLVDDNKRKIKDENTQGELVYKGKNIMLGYANNVSELAAFHPKQKLYTGDLARYDRDGDYFITGRVKRFVKIFGVRTNLDEVEAILEQNGYHVKVTGTDKRLCLALLHRDVNSKDTEQEVIQLLSKKIKLHPGAIRCIVIGDYPLKSNQKTDYSALLALFENGGISV